MNSPLKMSIAKICVALLLAGECWADAQVTKIPAAFDNYKRVKIDLRQIDPHETNDLLLAPDLKYNRATKKLDLNEWPFSTMEVIHVTCSTANLEIGFWSGPSEDPTFVVFAQIGEEMARKDIYAEKLVISSTCALYAEGEADKSFNVRTKYVIGSDGINEIQQPFYLVDKVCTISAFADLRSERCGKGYSVATVPKGGTVQILLADGPKDEGLCGGYSNFLVRTPFGLVGWVSTTIGTIYNEGVPLSCLIYKGD